MLFLSPRETGLNGMNSSIWEHFASGSFSPSTSPAFLSGPGAAELARLRQELDEANSTIKQWEDSWKQAKQVVWLAGCVCVWLVGFLSHYW